MYCVNVQAEVLGDKIIQLNTMGTAWQRFYLSKTTPKSVAESTIVLSV